MRLLEKYGDIVRIGPNTVLLNDPETAHVVLGFRDRLEKVSWINGLRVKKRQLTDMIDVQGPGYRALAMSGKSIGFCK